jgi:hypothetical protein
MAEMSLSGHVFVIDGVLLFKVMNPDRTKQKANLSGLQNTTVIVKQKSLEAKQGPKHLVEFLIARKQMAIAAHKHPAGR